MITALPNREERCRKWTCEYEDKGVYMVVNDQSPSCEERTLYALLSSVWGDHSKTVYPFNKCFPIDICFTFDFFLSLLIRFALRQTCERSVLRRTETKRKKTV